MTTGVEVVATKHMDGAARLVAGPMILPQDPFVSWNMVKLRQAARTRRSADTYSCFLARNAIYHSLGLLDVERGGNVLIPSYICRAAVDPFVAYGLGIEWYSVNQQCEPDLADIEQRITNKTRAVLAVHYFGFPAPIAQLRDLCDRHGLFLIEDCAHVLGGDVAGKSMGSFGDAAVFSWRKFLPVYDGAELVMNRRTRPAEIDWVKESALFSLKAGVNMLETSLRHVRQPALKTAYRAFRFTEAALRAGGGRYLRKAADTQPETKSLTFDLRSVNWRMSRLSRWTKNHSHVENIIEKRRHNYEILLNEFAGSSEFTPLFMDLPATVCPWIFPVVFPSVADAHLRLRDQGIPAVSWGGVRHPGVSTGNFAEADFLYHNLVFLPIHQCLTDEDVLTIAKTVKRSYAPRRSVVTTSR